MILKTNLYKILRLYHILFYSCSSNTQKYSCTFYLMIDGISFINTVIRNWFSTTQANYWESEEQRAGLFVSLFSKISFRVGSNSPIKTPCKQTVVSSAEVLKYYRAERIPFVTILDSKFESKVIINEILRFFFLIQCFLLKQISSWGKKRMHCELDNVKQFIKLVNLPVHTKCSLHIKK